MGGKRLEISYATYSGIGSREINEDTLGVFEKGTGHCFVLCDGLGGRGFGDVASALVVDVFKNQFSRADDMSSFLAPTFSASEDILMAAQSTKVNGSKMRTTAVALVHDDKNAYIGHVGDSRAYVFSKDMVMKRTLDHSVPQMMVSHGELEESQIRNHPDRNIILRALGVPWERPMFELMEPIPLKKCQAFLFCSDGFWALIDEKRMCDLLKEANSVGEWLEGMKRSVLANGIGMDMDNHSAIAVWCEMRKG